MRFNIGASKILPKHDKEMKAKKERNIENDFLKMKSMYQAKVTKPANYIEQKQVTLISPKQPKDFGSAETYDYLALKYETEVMEMIRGSGTSTSYELFTDKISTVSITYGVKIKVAPAISL